jgi:hypothetical protein
MGAAHSWGGEASIEKAVSPLTGFTGGSPRIHAGEERFSALKDSRTSIVRFSAGRVRLAHFHKGLIILDLGT